MSYSTRAEVRSMVKDDALNAIIGDTFIEDPAEREELVAPIIDEAIADACSKNSIYSFLHLVTQFFGYLIVTVQPLVLPYHYPFENSLFLNSE